MKMNFEFTFEKISLAEIETFEQTYDIELPEEYKRFLLSTNGGKTVNYKFETKDQTIASYMMLFLPLSLKNENNVEHCFTNYNRTEIIPQDFLPIGLDPMNNLICLSVTSERKGKVYFCGLTYFKEQQALRNESIRLIANSFDEFLYNLQIEE